MARKYDADSIVVIENDRDRVRQSPSMYVPDIYKAGAVHIIFEVIDNSIDELSVKEPAGDHLDITFDSVTKEVTVEDDGSGVPLEKLLDVLTKLAASGKFNNTDDTAYTTSGGAFGHGLKACCFLSKHMEFTSMREGKYLTYILDDGLVSDEKRGSSKKHGTLAKFTIDPAIIDTREVTDKDIRQRLEEKSYLFPYIKMTLTVLKKGEVVKTYKYSGKTIVDRVEQWKPDTPIVHVLEDRKVTYLKGIADDSLTTDKVGVDIVFAFKEAVLDAESRDEFIISYANSIQTYAGGTHNEGLKLGIQKYIRDVAIPKLKGKDKDLPIMPSDMVAGLCAFITVKVKSPVYQGQEKNQLANQEVKFAVRDAVYDALCNEKNSVTNAMMDFIKRVTRGRMASKKTRKKDVSSAFSKDRLVKFKDIVYNLETVAPELILVEGDSAADNAVAARDSHNQAVYGIKRPTNIYDLDSDHVERIKSTFNDVLDIMGVEPGKKCDPSKSTMVRVLNLTDGDVDGDDISNSVWCLFAKHCRPLIDAGMVGRILPPAYAIPMGGGKMKYVRSRREFFDKITKQAIKNETVAIDGKKLSKSEFRQFIERNFEYDTRLESLADWCCVDPKVAEYIAWCYHGEPKDQKKSYWMQKIKKYPGLQILVEHGEIVIDGDIKGMDYINVALDDAFHKKVMRFKEYQKVNSVIYGYSINGDGDKSLYDVMHRVRHYVPSGVQRFKGLGELSPDEMRVLCMDPKTRTVVICKFDDYEADMQKIDVIMSTKKECAEARKNIMFSRSIDPLDLDT